MEAKERFVRLPEVLDRTGLSSATIYRLEHAGRFPLRRRLGLNSVAWLESEVDHWLHSRETVCGGCHEHK
jgi:prophage regulatory protein